MVQETVDIEDIISIDEQESIDDELDLVNLVSNNANNANQYLLFLGSDAQYYAMNVSKIEELVSFKDIEIAYNHDKNRILMGTADIRGEIVSLINFDKWMGNEVSEDEYYKIVILASFGSKRFTMLVKDVEGITAVDASNMVDNSMDNSKSSFICKVNIEGTCCFLISMMVQIFKRKLTALYTVHQRRVIKSFFLLMTVNIFEPLSKSCLFSWNYSIKYTKMVKNY